MQAIVITGGILTGKSYLLELFALKNIPTFSCDKVINEFYQEKGFLKQINSISPTPVESKSDIAKIAFTYPEFLQALEDIIYPKLKAKIAVFKEENKNKDLVCLEIPLLFEKNFKEAGDIVITAFAAKEELIKRAGKRGLSLSQLAEIQKKQFTSEEKILQSDYAINTAASDKELNQIIDNIISDARNIT